MNRTTVSAGRRYGGRHHASGAHAADTGVGRQQEEAVTGTGPGERKPWWRREPPWWTRAAALWGSRPLPSGACWTTSP